MNSNIKEYLEKEGYKVNEKAIGLIKFCDKWYRNEAIDKFHGRVTVNNVNYDMERTGFAKRACEDDANLCEVVDITLENKDANANIGILLNQCKFPMQLRKQLELISATGTAASYVRTTNADLLEDGSLKGGNIEIVYVHPEGVFPLTIVNDEVVECAFASEDVVNGKAQTIIVIFKLEDGIYKSITSILDFRGKLKSRTEIDLGAVKPFAVLTTAVVNNIRGMNGYGYPKIYGAVPVLKVVDLVFNVLYGDLDKADKMVLYNEALCEFNEKGEAITPNKQHKKTFVSLGKKLPDSKEVIQEINPKIRVEDITKTFELALSLLSTMFGYGTRKYSFENGQIKTATEYVGTKQDQLQSLNRQRDVLNSYIKEVIRALIWFSNAFYKTDYSIDDGIIINYDDSFIIDKESELESMRIDAHTFGLPKLVKNYLQKKYGLTEDEANAWYDGTDFDDSETLDIENIQQQKTEETKRIALNGAQVNALMDVIHNVKDGLLNNEQAVQVITTSFGLSEEEARKLLTSN